jgi:uncharacterized protein (UPF0276 family)
VAIKIGARWDDPAQDERIKEAYRQDLIDYIEVNYPIPFGADPDSLQIPVLAHTSSNPTCSAEGVNLNVARRVKEGADTANSPWIGEHLSWLGTAATGSLGYQINPLFTEEFERLTVLNVQRLREFYERPVALELGPIYIDATGFPSEMHFLGAVANDADTKVIVDVTHWQIANRNLERTTDYGLDAIDPARIVELHVAGMRQGSDGFWHDAHDLPPNEEVLAITADLVRSLPALETVTFEHNPTAPEEDFFRCLADIGAVVGSARAV